MTPEERRELAERLDRMAELNERTAEEMGGLGRGWAKARLLRSPEKLAQMRRLLAEARKHPVKRSSVSGGAATEGRTCWPEEGT